MRDRYVGDIADFAKCGLLRANGKWKRLGIAWNLCVDPEVAQTGDGRHTAYLQRPAWFERIKNGLSACDLVFADPDNVACRNP